MAATRPDFTQLLLLLFICCLVLENGEVKDCVF